MVQRKKSQKVCFGSSCPREVLGEKGLSPYMRYHTPENHPNIAPWTYDPLRSFKSINTKPCHKSISQKGYSGIARRGEPLKSKDDFPAPCTYEPESYKVKFKQSKHPFNSSSTRKPIIKINKNPGPGTYTEWKNTGVTFQHQFGGRAKLNLAVEIKCCSKNTDICSVCGERPIGVYWHKDNKEFLCDSCMQRRRKIVKKYKHEYLNQFRKIRDCSTIHSHEGTEAKIWLMEPQAFAKILQKEAYLNVYFD